MCIFNPIIFYLTLAFLAFVILRLSLAQQRGPMLLVKILANKSVL